MEPIPVLNPTPELAALWQPLQEAVAAVLQSGRFRSGPNVAAFAAEAAAYQGARHALAVASGITALRIALQAAGIGPGAEVITGAFTSAAAVEAIGQTGARSVPADIHPATLTLDPFGVEAAVTDRTRAILAVHLHGQAADMEALDAVAKRHGLVIIEDAAHALGAEYRGRRLGTFGLAGCFGFDPVDQGGLIVTDDDGLAASARAAGARLGELEAAILRIKLAYTEEWNARRRLAARRYDDLLAGLPDLTLPVELPGCRHIYRQYVVRIGGGRRDAVRERLASAGIETECPRPFFKLPRAEAVAAELLALPIGPFLTLEEQDAVAAALRGALEG